MASATLAASAFLPSLPTANSNKHVSLRVPSRRLPMAVSAAPSGAAAAAAARERRRILERYGLNPDDFEDEAEDDSRDQRKRGKGRQRSGRGKEAADVSVSTKKAEEPRETHKMLQKNVWKYLLYPFVLHCRQFEFSAVCHGTGSSTVPWWRANGSEKVACGWARTGTSAPPPPADVLGGKVRRRKLLSPKDRNVRPMMEVVRGAAFDILQSAGGSPASLRPGKWLDLYSGTGSVGIEAMSRGCSEAHFVEMDPWVISEVLKPNLECTGFLGVSNIHMYRVENFLAMTEKSKDKYPSFDYISVTPPYLEVNYSTLLDQLARSPLVGKDCFILVEYPLKTDMPESCGSLIKIADRRFGRTNLLIYGPTWSQKKRRS